MKHTLTILTALLQAPLVALHAADVPKSTNPKATLPVAANPESAMEAIPILPIIDTDLRITATRNAFAGTAFCLDC